MIKIRKERNDKGQPRASYKTRISNHNAEAKPDQVKRPYNKTLNHLESLKLIKFQATNQFPLGPGRLQLV